MLLAVQEEQVIHEQYLHEDPMQLLQRRLILQELQADIALEALRILDLQVELRQIQDLQVEDQVRLEAVQEALQEVYVLLQVQEVLRQDQVQEVVLREAALLEAVLHEVVLQNQAVEVQDKISK